MPKLTAVVERSICRAAAFMPICCLQGIIIRQRTFFTSLCYRKSTFFKIRVQILHFKVLRRQRLEKQKKADFNSAFDRRKKAYFLNNKISTS